MDPNDPNPSPRSQVIDRGDEDPSDAERFSPPSSEDEPEPLTLPPGIVTRQQAQRLAVILNSQKITRGWLIRRQLTTIRQGAEARRALIQQVYRTTLTRRLQGAVRQLNARRLQRQRQANLRRALLPGILRQRIRMAALPPTTFRQFLERRALMATAAANELITGNGTNSLENLSWKEDDAIEKICKTIRKPGGMFIGPPSPGGTVPAAAAVVGQHITVETEERLMLIAFAVRKRMCCGRTYTLAEMDDDEIIRWKYFYATDKKYKEPKEDILSTDYDKNWPRTFEFLFEHFSTLRGQNNNVPLSYVIRKDATPKASADDPISGYKGNVLKEMETRCPHTLTTAAGADIPHPDYVADSKRVLTILAKMFKDTPSYSYMKPFVKKDDGRGAYEALFNHYLGPDNKNILGAKYDAEIRRLRYHGEKRNYNFEKYITAHVKCHNIFEDLKDYGHPGMSDSQKVGIFIDGIQCSLLRPVKAAISGDSAVCGDFNKVVNKYKDFMARERITYIEDPKAASIGAVSQGKAVGKKNPRDITWDTSDVKVDLRHHSTEEYRKLSGPQKLKLKRWRAGEPDMPVSKDTVRNADHASMKQVAALFAQHTITAKAPPKKKAKTTNKKTTNSNHKALTKGKGKYSGDDADEEE